MNARHDRHRRIAVAGALRDIPGFAGRYSATADGQIYSHAKTPRHGRNHEGMWLTPRRHRKGYLTVYLCIGGRSRQRFIHRLVALAFLQPVLGKTQNNHITCYKADNRVENLEWCTPAENARHAIRAGIRTVTPASIEASRRNLRAWHEKVALAKAVML